MKKILSIVTAMLALTCWAQSGQGVNVNIADSISHYKHELSKFPANAPATKEYLHTAFCLCQAYMEADSMAQSEQTAATALVRASALADSCWQAAALFSMLAYIYEQRGDSVMPERFHEKSQVLMMRYNFQKYHTDSVAYYNQRLNQLLNMRYQQKHLFGRKNKNYAYLNDELCGMVSQSGNTEETIHLGEQQLQFVRDSVFLATEDVCCETYYSLIAAYAASGNEERALALVQEAMDYYRRFPKEWATEAWLWWQVGRGLHHYGDSKAALPYLQKARKLSSNADQPWQEELRTRIRQCKGKL